MLEHYKFFFNVKLDFKNIFNILSRLNVTSFQTILKEWQIKCFLAYPVMYKLFFVNKAEQEQYIVFLNNLHRKHYVMQIIKRTLNCL